MPLTRAEVEALGNQIVSYLYDLHVQAQAENPNAPQQVFYDREEIRHAMGVESEEDFILALMWAENKGWITAQSDGYLQ